MGKQAREIQNRILQELPPNKRLFPINSGMGWVSDKVEFIKKAKTVRVFPGDVVVRHARPLRAAPKGWPDLCGFEKITVTQDMVGQKIAVFCAEEIKAGNDKLRPAQIAFRDLCLKFGVRWRIVSE